MDAPSVTWTFNGITFNGVDSQIVVPHNPLAGTRQFTLEARFLPQAGGEPEQRFVHVQGDDGSRALLELRSTAHGWYADTFVHFSSGERFLNDPQLLHPFERWHTLALIYTGSELLQKVNGQLELRAPAPFGVLATGSVSIGMRINRISPFKGEISTVRFSRQADVGSADQA